jgi:uncharacterized protein (DUF58 family)
MAIEVQPEPIVDESNLLASWNLVLPLHGVDLTGIPGGSLAEKNLVGGNRFLGIAEYEEGVHDASDIEAELTAEDPDHTPMVRVNHPNIRPTLWVASDMLRAHQTGIDGYFDKRGLALSAVYSLLRTSLNGEAHLPSALVASNDVLIDMTDRPKAGKRHFIDLTDRLQEMGQRTGDLPTIEKRPKLSEMLEYIASRATRSVVAIVSDFRTMDAWPNHPNDNWEHALDQIVAKHNEIIAIEITSPEDSEMQEKMHRVNYSPSDRIWAGRKGKQLRQRYAEAAEVQQKAISQTLSNAGAVHVRLRTDEPLWQTSLREQLKYPDMRVIA